MLSLYHNCDSITIRLRHDYDEKVTCYFLLASNRVQWKQARAIRRSRIVVVSYRSRIAIVITALNSTYYCIVFDDGLLPDIRRRLCTDIISVPAYVDLAAGRRAVTHCQEHSGAPATWVRHIQEVSEHVTSNSWCTNQSITLFRVPFKFQQKAYRR